MNVFQAIILAIIEGITEFLPISSTGHMIIGSALMGIEESEFVKLFTVAIQFGAILSVVVLYFKRFFKSFDFYLKLFVGVLPLIIGFLLKDFVDQLLGNVVVVAISLLVGGIILLFVDKWFDNQEEREITYKSAFIIGLFQCIALIPGVSRSAASIIGGMTQKLTRKDAAEFSFFLAVPTMVAATALKLFENYKLITPDTISILLIGNIVAFVVAMIAIKSFISILSKYGFKAFGYYRIIVGLVILILFALGIDLKIG
jgi:undecaprenyl-diphosphatase